MIDFWRSGDHNPCCQPTHFEEDSPLKVTKKKVAENRSALLLAAARLFRERGIDGVGVDEICKKAGLSHGALYAQFPSKEALAAEAFAFAFKRGFERIAATNDGQPVTLTDYLDYYLSFDQRDHLERSCPTSASAGEIARQDRVVSERFTDGFGQLVAVIEAGLNPSPIKAERRQRALAMMAAMMGGVAASRAVAKANPELSDEILLAVREVMSQVGGEDLQVRAKAREQRTKRH
jgi:TetR/AcrR family transcriptional regulator, transcriptional repressor for nem operon